MEGVPVFEPVAEQHAVLPRGEVGDGHHVLRAARELDQLGQDTAPGDVQSEVDAVRCERADPLHHALAVRHGLGSEEPEVVVVPGAGGADDARTAGDGQLDGGAADAPGRAVDEEGDPGADAELVQAARGGLQRAREDGRVDETERLRHRRAARTHPEFGCRATVGAPEDPLADGHVGDALADLVDDAGHVPARQLGQVVAEVHLAAAQGNVGGADADRAHDDPDLAGSRVRVGQIHDLEDLGSAEPVEPSCLHDLPFGGAVVVDVSASRRVLRPRRPAAGRCGRGGRPAPR